MNTAKQLLFLRIPATKEFVALVLLNLFFFVQFVAVFQAFETKVESQNASATFYLQHQSVKAAQPSKTPSLEKLTFVSILANKFFTFEAPLTDDLDELEANFFLSDQCSSCSLKGRAPPSV